MEGLHPALASWFRASFPGPSEAQEKAVPRILAGEDVLLSSPTGTGKTLAAFLGILSELHHMADAGTLGGGIRCIYVSPLKALAHDVARNLERPLAAMPEARVTMAIRTGETPPHARARQAADPPHVLVTTPESLALVLLAPRLRPALRRVRWVVVDEVHALAGTKRGAHLALALERLDALAADAGAAPPQRIGMSATVRPLEEAARFLVGAGRDVAIEEAKPREPCQLRVDLAHPDPLRARARDLDAALHARLDEALARNRTTLVFTNTRASAEELTMRLRERHDERLIAPHHGSMSKEERQQVEARLAAGELRGVVASSSLELGIHVDAAEEVLLLGSPKSAARALQRVGRSGHKVGAEARGLLLVTDPDEVLEAIALARLARRRDIEPLDVGPGGLDVLAQHLVALAVDGPLLVEDALTMTRRAWPYRDLARDELVAVLRHLRDDARLVHYDEREGAFGARSGRARWALAMGSGSIPRAGLVRVLDKGARFVGEVEEAFASALQEGDVFQLAGGTWRALSKDGLRLHVEAARSAQPTVPAWRSEGLAMTRAGADEARRVLAELNGNPVPQNADVATRVSEERLIEFIAAQARFSAVPAPHEVAWESFVTDLGLHRALVVHALVGRKATDALARAFAAQMIEAPRVVSSDAGFALLVARGERFGPQRVRALFAQPLAPLLDEMLPHMDLFLRRFRHVAERGLLLDGTDGGVTARQRRAQRRLRELLHEHPDHPLVQEARREVLEDALDVATAEGIRAGVAEGRIPLRRLPERPSASPFAAAILQPRASTVADASRIAALRDACERADEWLVSSARAEHQ